MSYSVAIDGPAGAGKSTIAKLLAKKMGCIYVDTGAMYRAMAVYFVQNNVNPDDEREINAAVTGVNITIDASKTLDESLENILLTDSNVHKLISTLNEQSVNLSKSNEISSSIHSKMIDINESLVSHINKSEMLDKKLNKIIKDLNSSLK